MNRQFLARLRLVRPTSKSPLSLSLARCWIDYRTYKCIICRVYFRFICTTFVNHLGYKDLEDLECFQPLHRNNLEQREESLHLLIIIVEASSRSCRQSIQFLEQCAGAISPRLCSLKKGFWEFWHMVELASIIINNIIAMHRYCTCT